MNKKLKTKVFCEDEEDIMDVYEFFMMGLAVIVVDLVLIDVLFFIIVTLQGFRIVVGVW